MRLMKKVRLLLLASIITVMALAPTVFAAENSKKEEENIIKIDAGHIKPAPANLVPDYNADFQDLVEQLRSQDSDYQLAVSEYVKSASASARKIELENNLADMDRRFSLTAENLLNSRYMEDKINLRPEILSAANAANAAKFSTTHSSSQVQSQSNFQLLSSYDWVIYPTNKTKNIGTYGTTSGDATYSHSANNNVSKVTADHPIAANSSASSGWDFMAVIAYPDETFRGTVAFRELTFSGRLVCLKNDSTAVFQVKTYIYNTSSNSFVGTAYNYVSESLIGDAYNDKTVSKGPSMVSYSNVPFTNGHVYRAYIETFATGSFGGSANAKSNSYGTKWERIEVTF